MIQKENHYFSDPQTGGLDADSSPFAIPNGKFVNAENFRFLTSDAGPTAVATSIGGNKMVSQPQPSVNFLEIGSVEDTENGRSCIFYKNTTGASDKIECYYTATQTTYTVLRGADVIGGLTFDKNFLIHSAKIVNGLLIFPNSTQNQPRCINIEAGIKTYQPAFVTNAVPLTLPVNFSEITLIKPTAAFSPNIQKIIDGGFANNFIANDSFEFAYQYIWYDNQTTVIGGYSPNSRLNKPTDTYNAIYVTMDSEERIPNGVKIVNLVVRYSNTTTSRIIKTWDKSIPAEAAQIAAQNTGTPISFTFYNNLAGTPIATDDTLRSFDDIGIYAETAEAARNRIFLGDVTEGYNTPLTTSLSIALTTTSIASGAALTKNVIVIAQKRFDLFPSSNSWAYSGIFVYLTEVSPAGYYAITASEQTVIGGNPPYPNVGTAPGSVAFTGLTFRGADLNSVYASTNPIGLPSHTSTLYNAYPTLITITGLSIPTYDIFKSLSQYKAGVVFMDFAMRRCGVITTDGLFFTIPTRNFAYSTGVNAALWQLSNANAVNEIPDWAYYYIPVRTLSQTTRFFVDSFTDAAKYAQKAPDGTYTFTSNTFVTGSIGIGLNTTALYQSGLGYVFTEGDVCILTRDDNTQYTLPIIGQSGSYVIVSTLDIGTLAGRKFVYELFTPYKTSDQEPFYDMGNIYKILNPGTIDRQYEVLGDIFLPDAYVLTRNYTSSSYFGEAMSPNDAFYNRWDNDGGKVNFITKLGQVLKKGYISWSDTFVPNTAVNGLSTFRVGNQKNVPEDCGGITKLQLTSKVESEGTIMLALCEVETCSLYLEEQQITDSTGATQYFSNTKEVIGTINTLKGNFGCIDPSIVQYRGNVYYMDANSGRIVQYSDNGLDAISDYKMVRFWKYWCAKYISMTKAQIEAFGDRPFVFMAIDTAHDELLITLPRLTTDPPKGYLPDYPGTVYPFDILDFRGKTIAYKIGTGAGLPRWNGAYPFTVEGFLSIQNKLFSFKNGNMYEHNQTGLQNNFFGVQYTSKIMFPANAIPQLPKIFQNILIQSNISPKFVYFYNDYPYQQASDLEDISFTPKEGLWEALILRNKLVPNATGFTTDGLLTAEQMRNTAMLVMVEFNPITAPLELRFVTIGFTESRGFQLGQK